MDRENSQSDNTRCVETPFGILRYSELIPLVAERVLRAEQKIAEGKWENSPFDWKLACDLHSMICGDLFPEWAGKARTVEVTVGPHVPPPVHSIRENVVNYFNDAEARLEFARAQKSGELLMESLAFIEGRFLSIHPFQDFNGRVIRLLLQEMCQRLDLPSVDLTPNDADRANYLEALRSADKMDWLPLRTIWEARLAT